jgi:RNA polymerase sigma factor (sigma-70 family)
MEPNASTNGTARFGSEDGHELVLATIRKHAASLLRTARRYSLCADDAQDAYQRALEIFVRRADSLDPEGAAPWLRTVVKHEALAVRAARASLVGPAEIDLDQHEATWLQTPEERLASFDRLTRSAEALQRLKPQELRALVLRAQGHSYHEICELTGWTYTKVNRCLTEGRKRFFDRYEGIESGAECERWAPVLSAIADGEASAEDLLAVRPHLRNCAGCRATLRDFRGAPVGLGALVPVAAVAAAQPAAASDPSPFMRIYEAVVGGVHERVAHSAHKLQAGVEAASTGKLAAVAASATAIAGGGAAVVDRPLDDARGARSQPVVRARAATVTPSRPARPPDTTPADIPGGSESSPQTAPPAPASRTRKAETQEFGFDGGHPVSGSAAAPPETAGSSAPQASSASDTAAPSPDSGGGEFAP